MTYYPGHNYYSMCITDRTARIGSSVFTTPHHLNKHSNYCCSSVKDIWIIFPDQEIPLNINVTPCFENNLSPLYTENLEPLSSIISENGEDLCIPSSNPESDCDNCSINNLLEKRENTTEETIALEHFLSHEAKYQYLELPLCQNELRLAIVKLPKINSYLARLHPIKFEDPLVEVNGLGRNKEYFLKSDLHLEKDYQDSSAHWSAKPLVESFFKSTFTEDNSILEAFLLPVLSKIDPPNYLEEIQTSEAVNLLEYEIKVFTNKGAETVCTSMRNSFETLVELGDERCSLSSFIETKKKIIMEVITLWWGFYSSATLQKSLINCSPVMDPLCNFEYDSEIPATIGSFLEINNTGIAAVAKSKELVDSHIIHPFLGLRQLKLIYFEPRMDLITEIQQMMNFHSEDGLLSSSMFLNERDLKCLERNTHEKERLYDEKQLAEPHISNEKPPNIVISTGETLSLILEELIPGEETLPWILDYPLMLSPTSEVTNLSMDMKENEHQFSEDYEKIMFFPSEFNKINIDGLKEEEIKENEVSLSTTLNIKEHDMIGLQPDLSAVSSSHPLDMFIKSRKKVIKGLTSQNGTKKAVLARPISNIGTEQENVHANSKTIQVSLSDPIEEVLKFIQDSASPYLTWMKKYGILSSNESFLDLSVDTAKFLLKEHEKLTIDKFKQSSLPQGETSKGSCTVHNLLVMYILRSSADLLLNNALESCISWITAQTDEYRDTVGNLLNEVCKQLIQHQYACQKRNIMHPKFTVLQHEISTFSAQFPGSKILVIIERNIPLLGSSIQNLLNSSLNLKTSCVTNLKSLDDKSIVIIAPYYEYQVQQVTKFLLVVQFDEKLGAYFKIICKENDISYIGLITQYNSAVNARALSAPASPPTTLICSTSVTEHTDLIYLLEARYNIRVIERDYKKLPNYTQMYFADAIVSLSHCVALISLQEMGKQLELEKNMKRFVALGLQFSYCYIILHGMDSKNSYLLDKETKNNIYKLNSALVNLSSAAPNFTVEYKVFLSLTVEDIAEKVREIINVYLISECEQELDRSWINTDVLQDEEILLQISCLNSFSAQLLLKSLSLKDIFRMTKDEIKSHVPLMPDHILEYLKNITMDWICPQLNSSSCSQVSATVPSEKSFFSTSNKSTSPVSSHSPFVNDYEWQNSLKNYTFGEDKSKGADNVDNEEHNETCPAEIDYTSAIETSEDVSHYIGGNTKFSNGTQYSRPNVFLNKSSSKSIINNGYGIFSSKAERSCDTNLKTNNSDTQNNHSQNGFYGNYPFNFPSRKLKQEEEFNSILRSNDSFKTGTADYEKTLIGLAEEVKPLNDVIRTFPNTGNENFNIPATKENSNYHRNYSLANGPGTAPNIYSLRCLPKESAEINCLKAFVSNTTRSTLPEIKKINCYKDFCNNMPKQIVKLPHHNTKNSTQEQVDLTRHLTLPLIPGSPKMDFRLNIKPSTHNKWKCTNIKGALPNEKYEREIIDIPQVPFLQATSKELGQARPPSTDQEHSFLSLTNYSHNNLLTKTQQRQRGRSSGSPPMDLTYDEDKQAAAEYKSLNHLTSIAKLEIWNFQIMQMNHQRKERPMNGTTGIPDNHTTALPQPVPKRRKLELENID